METAERTYNYSFVFPDQTERHFALSFDSFFRYINNNGDSPPHWSRLDHNQCPPCPLSKKDHPFCPIALNISDVITAFNDTLSYEHCSVTCSSPERTVFKETVAQEGLASIFGLLMAASGCPIMDFFRPLARFHLPFATVEESTFRVTAVYLLKQYYTKGTVLQGNTSFAEIKTHYALVKQINKGILQRVRNITERDADQNAIINLDCLGQILEMEIDTNLEIMQQLFVEK